MISISYSIIGIVVFILFLSLAIRNPFSAFMITLPFIILTRTVYLPLVRDRLTVFDILVAIIGFALLIKIMNTGESRFIKIPGSFRKGLWILSSMILWFLISCFKCQEFASSIVAVTIIVFLIYLVTLTVILVDDRRKLRNVFTMLQSLGILAALIAIFNAVGVNLGFSTILYERSMRMHGTFKSTNQLASFLLILLPFYLVEFVRARSLRSKLSYFVAIVIQVSAIFLTASRSHIILMLLMPAAYLVYILVHIIVKGKISKLRGGILFLGIPVAIYTIKRFLPRSLEVLNWRVLPFIRTFIAFITLKQGMPTPFPREQFNVLRGIWAGAWKAFLDSPIFGIGIGNFGYIGHKYTGLTYHLEVHNTFLSILSETGLMGFGFFAMFLIYVFLITYKNSKTIRGLELKKYNLMLALSLLAFLGTCVWHIGQRNRWFWLLIALVFVIDKVKKEEKR